MRISLKHEAMRAGNVSVTDIYNCSEVELRTMVERDRCLRAIRMGCSPRDIALRTPQTILQELWNACVLSSWGLRFVQCFSAV